MSPIRKSIIAGKDIAKSPTPEPMQHVMHPKAKPNIYERSVDDVLSRVRNAENSLALLISRFEGGTLPFQSVIVGLKQLRGELISITEVE